jgi:uncharacterized protein YaiL (DUF2058 family)
MAKNPLQAQLLKAGLVKQQDIKTVNTQQKKTGDDGSEAARLAREALAEKQARDRALAEAAKEAQRQKELAAQVRQIILHARVSRAGGDVPYHFTDGKSVKKLNVTRALADQLSWGQLAVVRFDDHYELVPARAAEKLRERNPEVVVALHVPESNRPAEDDPYADYKIPDDLMW